LRWFYPSISENPHLVIPSEAERLSVLSSE
jgi:hypothetical protein